MDDANCTDALRAMAPKWSLAGDDQLLNILQSTHQRIISNCKDVNSKLEEMASALDDASINLQNVNNKFMALSNSQFIESRVYDDDLSEVPETRPLKELPQPSPIDELNMIKNSLAILERAHETAEILDDSDSDSDVEISVVLKPKDMYADRPLPYIIGSQPWKNKWHAGLIVEESDSDSSTSKHDVRDIEQYSDTESEHELTERPHLEDRTISETSSSFNSEPPVENTPPVKQKPSDIAAELARRLGGPPQVAEPDPEEYSPPVPTTRKVYKPEKPPTSTIFSDEPPPLDTYEPEDMPSDDDDIFAEINKNKPYTQKSNTVQNNLAEDLFSFDKPYEAEQGDIFSDFAVRNVVKKPATQKSTLFEDESEPELFAEAPKKQAIQNNNNIEQSEEETSTKKPVGGISLFGSNKGAESIGAAILKRNRRKSSSGDESGSDNVHKQNVGDKPNIVPRVIGNTKSVTRNESVDELDNKSLNKKDKDIFDDLFSKSASKSQNKAKDVSVKDVPVKSNEKNNVKDLFSDNIFDDIDDIFTSNVKIPAKDSNQKSIFDDDDDLFSDIAKPKSIVTQTTSSKSKRDNDKKSIFDSDDELFRDIETNKEQSKNHVSPKTDNNTSTKTKEENNSEANSKVDRTVKATETTKEINLFDNSPQNNTKNEIKPPTKIKSIFDSDSDEDIFANIKNSENKKSNVTENLYNHDVNGTESVRNEETSKTNKLLPSENVKSKENANVFQSPSLFEEDEIDDLFINKNISKNKDNDSIAHKDTKIDDVENMFSISKETTVKDKSKVIKTRTISNEGSEVNVPHINNSEQRTMEVLNKNVSKQTAKEADIINNSQEEGLFSPEVIKQEVYSHTLPDEKIRNDDLESTNNVYESKFVGNEDVLSREIKNSEKKENEVINHNVAIEIENQAETEQSIFDDFIETAKEKHVLTSVRKKPVSTEPNVFDDIFTEPPAFEKPSEPKKSKNVNALFDDDSDDESLFFKKNDVISDEKPDIFVNANFDIFVDEPPAIDVDFTTNSTKHLDLSPEEDDIFSSGSTVKDNLSKSIRHKQLEKDVDLFSSVPTNQECLADSVKTDEKVGKVIKDVPQIKHEDIYRTPEEDKNPNVGASKAIKKFAFLGEETSDDELFSSLPKPNLPRSSQIEKPEQNECIRTDVLESSLKDEFEDILESTESPRKELETKKIGKIDTKNFNINVNALIPGASPKKIPKSKSEDNTPNQEDVPKLVKIDVTNDEKDNSRPKSDNNIVYNEELSKNLAEVESKAAKSITFEEKPESEVLDNNASKQRARIQVKRRPSSRRARHEAVRKSAIDLGDETDNSSSIDEPLKNKEESNNVEQYNDELDKTRNVSIDDRLNSEIIVKADKEPSLDTRQKQSTETNEVTASETVIKTSNIEANILPSSSETDNKFVCDNDRLSSSNINKEASCNYETKHAQEHKSTTKVVYILNDEDIFNTNPKNIQTKSNEDLFGIKNQTKSESKVANEDINSDDDIFKSIEGVKTLGNTYKDNSKQRLEVIQKDVNTKNKIGDVGHNENNIKNTDFKKHKTDLFDDSDEELFNKSKKPVKNANIFDSDSEEDLFTGKKKTEKESKEQKNQEMRKKEVNVKESLFGEDSDDDLFGVTKERTVQKTQATKPSTSKETQLSTASKLVQPVFDDPLSMLGEDD